MKTLYSLNKKEATKWVITKTKIPYNDLQNNDEIDVQQIYTSNYLTNLFTKILPTVIFEKLIYRMRIDKLKILQWCNNSENTCYTFFFLYHNFVPLDFYDKIATSNV